jgi:hypothetical protein
MDKKLYIGQNEVVTSDLDSETGLVKYTLDNNEFGEVTPEQFESLALEEAYDPGMVQIHKWTPAVKQILEILLKNQMQLREKDFVLTRIDESLTRNYEDALAFLFKKKHVGHITLQQIDEVLKNPR